MRDLAIHESGAQIDLADPSPEHQALLRAMLAEREEHHRSIRKGVLTCAGHGSPMYLRPRDGVIFACHWPGTGEGSHRVALMSPEHRIQTEYVARAADKAGLKTAFEVSLPTHVRPDLVIGDKTAVEVQRSHLTVGHAKSRTAKAINAGMAVSLWVSDKEPKYAPKWMYEVPSATAFARDWNTMPPLGSATITSGVRMLVPQPCRPPYRTQCPVTKRGWCGQQHLGHEPRLGLSLDALAVGVANGEYVPALVGGHVLLAHEDEVRRYDVAWTVPAPATPDRADADWRVECRAPTAPATAPVPAPPTPVDWRGHAVGVPQPCRCCGKQAFMRDELGRPCHKVCAEYNSRLELWP